jgi:predicted transcriptional regulator
MSRKKVNNVRSLREELLLSKAELARRAGVSALTVDRIEGGANCRVDTKRKIILALGKMIEQKHEVFPEFGSPNRASEGEES